MWLRPGGRKVRARRSPPCLDDTIAIAYSSMQYEYIHTYFWPFLLACFQSVALLIHSLRTSVVHYFIT